jgi:hypothetical protein
MIIRLIFSQCFFFVADARNRISCLEKLLSSFVVSHASIFMIFRALNNFALMKKLSTNKACDWFAERFLQSWITSKDVEVIFHMRAEKSNFFADFNSLILTRWAKNQLFRIQIFDILTSDLKDKEKIIKIIFLTQTVQLELYFSRFASQLHNITISFLEFH